MPSSELTPGIKWERRVNDIPVDEWKAWHAWHAWHAWTCRRAMQPGVVDVVKERKRKLQILSVHSTSIGPFPLQFSLWKGVQLWLEEGQTGSVRPHFCTSPVPLFVQPMSQINQKSYCWEEDKVSSVVHVHNSTLSLKGGQYLVNDRRTEEGRQCWPIWWLGLTENLLHL